MMDYGSSQAVQTTNSVYQTQWPEYVKPPPRKQQATLIKTRLSPESYVSRISCPSRKLFYAALLNQEESVVKKPKMNKSRRQNADNSNFEGDSLRHGNRTVGPLNQNPAVSAAHLKYGLFGRKRSKITKVQSRAFSVNQPHLPLHQRGIRQDTTMPGPGNIKRQGQSVSPKPVRRITNRRKKELSVSDVMHVDIRPNAPKPSSKKPSLNPITKEPLAAREQAAPETRAPPLEPRHYPKFTSRNRKSLPIIRRISSMENANSTNVHYTINAPQYNISSNHSYSKLAKRTYVSKGL